jgi:hypothetical protein
MIPATWFGLPIVDSSNSLDVLPEDIILFMSSDHLLCLSVGKEINKLLVLIILPQKFLQPVISLLR